MRSVNLFLTLMVLSLLFTIPLYALSLEQSVFYTIKTNPDVIQKQKRLEGLESDRRISRGEFFPKLDISAGYGFAQDEIIPSYRISGKAVQRVDTYALASLNLFNGFSTMHEMQSQKNRVRSGNYNLSETKGVIALKTIESYISMMKQKAILKISQENVKVHQEIYEKLQEKDASGFGNASDMGYALGRLTLAEVNTVINENNFIQSKVIFESIYGKSVDEGTLQEPKFEYNLPKTLKDAALIALDNNPSIQVGFYNKKSARSNYQRSQSVYYPKIDLQIKGSWFEESLGYDFSVNSSYAMVYLTYNLFNGLSDSASVQKEFYNFEESSQHLESIKRDVTKRLGTSWVAAVKIKRQLELLAKMKAYSKKTKEGYYEEFGIGKRTLIDLINVNSDYNSARQSYESARYDYMQAQYRILEALGGVVDYFLSRATALKVDVEPAPREIESVYEILEGMDRLLDPLSKSKESTDANNTTLKKDREQQ